MVRLPDWVQGALRASLLITWYQQGTTTPEDLTDATLTGFIRPYFGGTVVEIAGVLEVVDDEAGIFRWDFDAEDVATAGKFYVQFNAEYPDDRTPAKTFPSEWNVFGSLSVAEVI